jgi:hypothetical protein
MSASTPPRENATFVPSLEIASEVAAARPAIRCGATDPSTRTRVMPPLLVALPATISKSRPSAVHAGRRLSVAPEGTRVGAPVGRFGTFAQAINSTTATSTISTPNGRAYTSRDFDSPPPPGSTPIDPR